MKGISNVPSFNWKPRSTTGSLPLKAIVGPVY